MKLSKPIGDHVVADVDAGVVEEEGGVVVVEVVELRAEGGPDPEVEDQ